MKQTLPFLISGLALASCSIAPSDQKQVGTSERAMATCDCPPGYHCESYSEDPGSFFCAPNAPRVVYVPVGQFCGFGTDEEGQLVDFRCRLDAHCDSGTCVCTHFPGGPCGPITCPEGTFCEYDVYGDFWCGRYDGECSGP